MAHRFSTRLIAQIACITALAGAAKAEFDPALARTNCEAEWPGDFQMIRYCLDQQTTAAGKLAAILPTLDDTMQARYAVCSAEWDADFTMRAYCLEQQIDARSRLPATLAPAPDDVAGGILDKCAADWGTDFAMLDYCAGQQIEAWQTLNN